VAVSELHSARGAEQQQKLILKLTKTDVLGGNGANRELLSFGSLIPIAVVFT